MKYTELALDDSIQKAIAEMGFVEPTPVQEKVIPKIIAGSGDIIVLAQTGTGKTAAFGLPLMQTLQTKNKNPEAIILCPTRELCIQITKDLTAYAKYSESIRMVSVYGGSSIENQISKLKRGVQIVVATPGRLNDLIRRRRIVLKDIKTVILDEADEMLNMGFQEELDVILSHIPSEHQTLLFSATMPKQVANIAKKYMHKPEEIVLGNRNSGSDDVNHVYYMVHARDRYRALKILADYYPHMYSIVFCRTKAETQEVANSLMQDGYDADSLHGDLSQGMRDRVMEKFRKRNLQILVATDVAARGLDVKDLTHIINYNLPDDVEYYTHRSGRTGRAGKKGTSICIINMREKFKIKRIEKIIKKEFEYKRLPDGKEICEAQLFKLLDRLVNVEVNEKQIEQFLPGIYESFSGMDGKEIIKKFVSSEFNRFLEYYKDARDLNAVETERSIKERKTKTERIAHPAYLNINAGKSDGMTPKNLILLINNVTRGESVNIGQIVLLPKLSNFEIDKNDLELVTKALDGVEFQGRQLKLTEGKAPSKEGRSGGKPDYKKKNFHRKGGGDFKKSFSKKKRPKN